MRVCVQRTVCRRCGLCTYDVCVRACLLAYAYVYVVVATRLSVAPNSA